MSQVSGSQSNSDHRGSVSRVVAIYRQMAKDTTIEEYLSDSEQKNTENKD